VIKKRGSSYGVRIYLAGKQVWVGSFDKYGDAKKAEREAYDKLRPAQDETVAQFTARWLRDFKRPRASTNRHNAYMVQPLAVELGGTKMGDISRRRAREWALGHPSSVPAVRAMFNDALDEEVVVVNPFANLRLSQKRGRKDLNALSVEELHELADTALRALSPESGPIVRTTILFAAYVGLRPAEMFRLKRTDLEGDEVVIRRSLGSTGEVTLPKNGKTRRVIVPPEARQALREMPTTAGSPYVFNTPRGRPFSKTSHYYYWRAVKVAWDRPQMDFYELRHFCATYLLGRGTSHADVAVQLGHTDGGALVMSTYGHPSEEAARDRLRKVFATNSASRLRAV